MQRVSVFLLMVILLAACKGKEKAYTNAFDNPVLYAKTVKELNNVVMQNNFPPIIASRNYVYAYIAA